MLYAIDEAGNKYRPTRNGDFYCPCCESKVIAKMGSIKVHHWAHISTEINCDSKPMSEWHLEWQSHFPKENVEVYVNKRRRADVLLNDGCVVEFQNSSISLEDIYKRSQAAVNGIIWVHNVIRQNMNRQFSDRKEVSRTSAGDIVFHGYWDRPIMIFDRQRVPDESIFLQFSEQSLGKLCWIDYSTSPSKFSFIHYTKEQLLKELLIRI